jgi:hypothetical protein
VAAHAWLIIPFLIALVVSAVFLGMTSSQASCLPTSGVHGLLTSQSHSKICSAP